MFIVRVFGRNVKSLQRVNRRFKCDARCEPALDAIFHTSRFQTFEKVQFMTL